MTLKFKAEVRDLLNIVNSVKINGECEKRFPVVLLRVGEFKKVTLH